MTAMMLSSSGAPLADEFIWNTIVWDKINKAVNRLQMRIAKAAREGRYGKAKALQRLLTHSFHAKLLAVKRVTENDGSKTAGIDGVTWDTSKEKIQATRSLRRRGYRVQPLRRIYIPKKKGRRPLGIPTMQDRAQQAVHLLALEPIAETTADINSYGFRPKRSCHDAIEQCFNALARKTSSQYILEGDIKSCFDKISHPWLESNICTDVKVLHKWLAAGYIEKAIFHHTKEGTPQGGIISPVLANCVLDGLEALVKNIGPASDKIHFVRYADDFVITASSRDLLENKIKPAITQFLDVRGLTLSEEKTLITHIDDGFNFLGFNLRKYNGKLLIKPAKQNVLSFIRDIRKLIKDNEAASTAVLIKKLNARVRGWANYYRHAVSKRTFSYVDHCIFQALWQWVKKRHPRKSLGWIRKKYFRSQGLKNWIFYTPTQDSKGNRKNLDLFRADSVKITRHIKIKSKAHPYDPEYIDYFKARDLRRKKSKKAGECKRDMPIF